MEIFRVVKMRTERRRQHFAVLLPSSCVCAGTNIIELRNVPLRLKRTSGGPDTPCLLCSNERPEKGLILGYVNETISETEGRLRRMDLIRRHYIVRENIQGDVEEAALLTSIESAQAPTFFPVPPLRPQDVRGHIPVRTKRRATPLLLLMRAVPLHMKATVASSIV